MVRKQREQTLMRRVWPFTVTVVVWTLTSKRRLVARIEKDRLCPKSGPLPQVMHLAMMPPLESFGCLRRSAQRGRRAAAAWELLIRRGLRCGAAARIDER